MPANIFDFHADDFGISENSCNDIIKLIDEKKLNSISLLPNMKSFDYAVNLLKQRKDTVSSWLDISVHINFMEGHCCSDESQITSLVDEKGFFKISWGKLFIYNYIPFLRRKIKQQLQTEIIAQTQKCLDSGIIKNNILRFDSHQHTHMIPLVFEALLASVKYFKQQGYKTEFIRNTQDPITPYFKAKTLTDSYNKINIIKCLILNFYSINVRVSLKKLNLPVYYLCGVFFSGHMDFSRLEKVLPFYIKKSSSKNRKIELLFHPGSVKEEEISEEFVKPDSNSFHLSENRKIEYDSIEQFFLSEYSIKDL